jgi:hypothetical protein
MRKIPILLLLVTVGLACAACNLPQRSDQTLPAPTTGGASPVPTAAVPPATTAGASPATTAGASPAAGGQPSATAGASPIATPDPNDVVQAYLIAYPDDTQGMLSCLSSALKTSLPAGGPGMLLQAEGDVNGFVIVSGSEVPNPPQAVVQVALEAGGSRLSRTFNLIQENGKWVINSITP